MGRDRSNKERRRRSLSPSISATDYWVCKTGCVAGCSRTRRSERPSRVEATKHTFSSSLVILSLDWKQTLGYLIPGFSPSSFPPTTSQANRRERKHLEGGLGIDVAPNNVRTPGITQYTPDTQIPPHLHSHRHPPHI